MAERRFTEAGAILGARPSERRHQPVSFQKTRTSTEWLRSHLDVSGQQIHTYVHVEQVSLAMFWGFVIVRPEHRNVRANPTVLGL
jgi:hypothetical protein